MLFLHADDDGYKLDANHDTPIEADDLPALAQAYVLRESAWDKWTAHDAAVEGTRSGGLPMWPRCARTTSTCRRGAIGR